jgi:hypothetical protein
VCGTETFWQRRAQLHSGVATFFNLEWASPTCECLICSACGYVTDSGAQPQLVPELWPRDARAGGVGDRLPRRGIKDGHRRDFFGPAELLGESQRDFLETRDGRGAVAAVGVADDRGEGREPRERLVAVFEPQRADRRFDAALHVVAALLAPDQQVADPAGKSLEVFAGDRDDVEHDDPPGVVVEEEWNTPPFTP